MVYVLVFYAALVYVGEAIFFALRGSGMLMRLLVGYSRRRGTRSLRYEEDCVLAKYPVDSRSTAYQAGRTAVRV